MWPFSSRRPAETRANADTASIPVSSQSFMAYFGIGNTILPHVDVDSALSVPAVWCATSFLSRTLAALPRHAYRTNKDKGPQLVGGKLETVLNAAPNDGMNAFKFWQYFWQGVFTGGRGLAYIERTPQGVEALWQMDPYKTSIQRRGGKLYYQFADIGVPAKEYPAEDVIDVPFMLKSDGISHYGPITQASKAIQLAIAMNDYASNFFAGGGVPPLALVGPLPAGAEAMKRAQADINRAIDAAKKSDKPIFPIPAGHDLKPVGFDPAKGQMLEARRFQVEEIARAYQLPPVFLQDLERATFTNSEQQDLHFVKHLIGQWARALEDEMDLKLFGRDRGNRYVEHDLDGLMRGDLSSRMNAYAQAVQNGIRTPNEVRENENLPSKGEDADRLYIQGATVPLGTVLTKPDGGKPADAGKPADGGKAAGNDNKPNEAKAA